MLCYVFWSQVEYGIVCFISELDQTVDVNICNGEVTEKQLIESRAKRQFQESDSVCAFHRYSLESTGELLSVVNIHCLKDLQRKANWGCKTRLLASIPKH